MVGATLVNCDAEGIKFLFDILQEVSGILQEAELPSAKMAAMNGVKSVLKEALEGYRRSGDDTGTNECQNLSERESGSGDSEDVNETSNVEEWNFGKLCKWILDQIRANSLGDNGNCKQIMFKLEERCASPKTENETSDQAVHADTSQGGAIEGAHDFSPISLLPVELLQYIFSLVASPPLWIRAPLVLSLVNSHFRTIVLDLPSLWAAVDNSLPLTILQLYITRSKIAPLDVLTRTDDPPSESTCSAEDWYNFLHDEATRIEHMAVVGDPLDMVLGLVSLVIEGFDLDCDEPHDQPIRSQVILNSLEKLELTDVSITDMDILSLYLSTPNLSSLSITSSAPCDGITDFLAAFTVHRPQLSSLRILGFNLELRELKRSLGNLANLTHLCIRGSEVADNDLALLEEGEPSPRLMVAVT
ncbi:hypothetical protein FS837_008879 [Tulasnella sp. UAMH 9824]|nr:hypothetical protein FS837_008879 [Tulasnella sp. UAMH 9824]